MANIKHNMYGTPTYKSWSEMIQRCENPHNISYKNYGGKGIKVCDEWHNFKSFYRDMGKRRVGTTLDRIDVNGDYEQKNCRWATSEQQHNNMTTNVYYMIDGEKMTLSQISRKYNISRSNLANKIYINKMDILEAIDYLIIKKRGV